MKIVVVDIYGDNEETVLFEDRPGIEKAIDEFVRLDDEYCSTDKEPPEWDYFTSFMEKRGFKALEKREVTL